MRWIGIIALLITVTVTAGVVRDEPPSARAQDATPATGQDAIVRALATASLEVSAPGTVNLRFERVDLAPGAVFHVDASDPSTLLLVVAAGVLTGQVDMPLTVTRREHPGTQAIPP